MSFEEKSMHEFGRLICSVISGRRMSRAESREAYRQVILNLQPELQQGAFLAAHIATKPGPEELAGAWEAIDLYDTAKISSGRHLEVCDIVGTGSDQLKTVNCSTPASLIASACGLPVAKKGAKLVTGVSGATDILEILGIDMDLPLSHAEKCLDEHGICYLAGEAFLKSGWGRLIKSMRFTSAFNIVGPLARPCENTKYILIGAYAPQISHSLIEVLRETGTKAAMSPFGMSDYHSPEMGMDEFSPCGTTTVVELRDGRVTTREIRPADFGITALRFEVIASSPTAEENAKRIHKALKSEYENPDAVFFCMNAAAMLYIAGKTNDFKKAYDMAASALASGAAYEKLQALREYQGKIV